MYKRKIYKLISLFLLLIFSKLTETKRSFPGIICNKECSYQCIRKFTQEDLLKICITKCLCNTKLNDSLHSLNIHKNQTTLNIVLVLSFSLIMLAVIGFNLYNYLRRKFIKTNTYQILTTEERGSKLLEI